MLAELVETLKKTELQAAPADHCYAGAGDLACDVCTGRKLKAFKTCLVCLARYCEEHLQPHYESPAFKNHQLVEPSVKLEETICSHHDEAMKLFCCTDQQCICYLCSMDEHKGHEILSASSERTKKQKELEVSQQKLLQIIQNRETELTMLEKEIQTINSSAIKATMNTDKISNELIDLIKKICSDVKQQIRTQQKTEVNCTKKLRENLQQEITELKKKNAKLEQLLRTEDPTQFLQSYPSLSQLTESTDSPDIKIPQPQYFEDVTAAVAATRDRIQVILSEKLMKFSLEETNRDDLLPLTEPKIRGDFLQYSRQITLDPNTANPFLVFSEGNRKVAFQINSRSYALHPNRFIHISQVLSKFGLTGRCYWEVEKNGKVAIAVSYKSISRSGDFKAPVFGYNEHSWVLHCSNNCSNYTFKHNNTTATVSGPPSSRIGVYLDHSAGILSFYSAGESMTLLHRVQTTFTQPLYAGLGLSVNEDTAELCQLIKI
ncbi:Tripartite motif-containing protein 16 Estrogen-responsive B box protein [Channa argus]|uniref:Tripartite motif-containing protein 16 Estrogen-responsive B box protein n=2 Tax=Channa argus TaxID=215402 RepID=A0A6G1Q6B2_CHAAH|nr:Tripartite motif-containing protein 16 Estrogen-responsive B box protein [Channa argus]